MPIEETIDFGFDVTVESKPGHTDVYLIQDDYEGLCSFMGLSHLEQTIESLIAARNWCRRNASESFKSYVEDRYQKQIEMAEFVDKAWSNIKR